MKGKNILLKYLNQYKWKYVWGILTLFIVDFIQLYIPQFTGEITDGLESHTMNMKGLLFGIGKILIVGGIIALGRFFWRYFLFGSSRAIECDIRNDLFAHLEKLSMSYYNKNKTGDLMSHFTNDLNAVRMSIGPAVITVKTVDHLEGDIEINNLSFQYPGENYYVLKEISVHIEKGSTLAILGRTGSGKTTLANLLLRMYNVEPGQITMDGYDIREIPLKTLRENIAYVPQDNFLFSDTLGNNIAFGSATADKEIIEQAAKEACIHDNIMNFPLKYDTMVGERGVTLSGGQKQRSSIARALMKNAPILILDDSLSAVDTNTEGMILDNLKKNRQGKTTIIIAHRISTIQHANHILVLEDGQIAEYGTHEELLKKQGIYAKMYEKQQLEKQLEAV